MKRLTLLIMLIATLASARAQEPVDYGIEIIATIDGNEYRIRITEDNKDAVLRDFLENSYFQLPEELKSNNVSYNQETNTLSIKSFVLAGLYDIIVEPTCPTLTIELRSMDGLELIKGEQSDITLSALGEERNINLESSFFKAKSFTLSEGIQLSTGLETARIETQKLIIEKDAGLHIVSWSPSVIGSLIVNSGSLVIRNDEDGNAIEQDIDNVELNGSFLDEESKGYTFNNGRITGQGPLLSIKPDIEQPVIDYGITVSNTEKDFSVKVTSENCDDVLKDVMAEHGGDSHKSVVYHPDSNTLCFDCGWMGYSESENSLYWYAVEADSTRAQLSISCINPDIMNDHHLMRINAPQTDVTFSAEGYNENGYSCRIYAQTLTLKAGRYPLYPNGFIQARKLVLEPGCKAEVGGAQCPPPAIDSLTVNKAQITISTMDYYGQRPGDYFDNLYVELNGSSLASPSYTYDAAQHRIELLDDYPPYEDIDVIKIVCIGDLNNDAQVDVADVNLVIDVVLGKLNNEYYKRMGDLNHDGIVDVSDVNMLIDIILGK